ncbi:SHOCT domain-containing protein [Nocardiopsis algeriensis]|uniref:Putative membrane protein n=1 Tax=Nocardiopsis algeriensis TaxID=1478215 RepID=A0A841IUX1_9ACTN|nr:SHOCT domain-containing protein [Nocardiopsis algeriensis]MBB6119958.1 putative membrane protein [Nocardiopsis algeriensis]
MSFFLSTIVILTMVAVGVYLVVTVSAASQASGGRLRGRQAQPPALDPAQEELRLRYARGEIDREEFLQRKIDLED